MTRRTWDARVGTTRGTREATLAGVVEAIDRHAPETKADLAGRLDLSEHYLSELLRELKAEGVVSKAYVVDREAVYESAPTVSPLLDARDDGREGPLPFLRRLDEVTVDQYRAARDAFADEPAELSASQLESLANERCMAALEELKSLTLTTDWPGARAAADLTTVAVNMELVGDHACFVSETVADRSLESTGVIRDRILDVFAAGLNINDHLGAILYDGELGRVDELYAEEGRVHRQLDELFELVTAYDTELFGHLAAVTRALERSIYYWVSSAELAVGLHAGVEPDHLGG